MADARCNSTFLQINTPAGTSVMTPPAQVPGGVNTSSSMALVGPTRPTGAAAGASSSSIGTGAGAGAGTATTAGVGATAGATAGAAACNHTLVQRSFRLLHWRCAVSHLCLTIHYVMRTLQIPFQALHKRLLNRPEVQLRFPSPVPDVDGCL